jgi:hypothetical protein
MARGTNPLHDLEAQMERSDPGSARARLIAGMVLLQGLLLALGLVRRGWRRICSRPRTTRTVRAFRYYTR